MHNFNDFEKKLKEIENWFQKELGTIRTGRANATLLDSVMVEAYGTRSPINQVAGIVSEDARTLRINAWDTSIVKSIEKAIMLADIGVSTVVDDKGIRVIFPDLTSERREALIKQIGKKLEEARISVRNDRTKELGTIQDKVKSGTLNEDDQFRLKREIQVFVDKIQEKLEEMAENKENEIKS